MDMPTEIKAMLEAQYGADNVSDALKRVDLVMLITSGLHVNEMLFAASKRILDNDKGLVDMNKRALATASPNGIKWLISTLLEELMLRGDPDVFEAGPDGERVGAPPLQ